MLLLTSFLVNDKEAKNGEQTHTVLWTVLCFAVARKIQSLVKTQVL